MLAASAYAQNPPGASSEQQTITNSKQQSRAQAKVDARPQGKAKKPVGDEAKSSGISAIATGKDAAAGKAGIGKEWAMHG
ncbi:hypothetical protein [Variovorax ginsengisoli]|uniref:Uncharacterized protein n=1 Tax=Variovorax ginsengisoli TaxID=363844 RepID=A0ABT8RX17_9BURK|nr:hypothetical protein [Variovorax ginsengisoli]MDN8611593.1 hypothetical protein [Variovorax ginsengisoli]MDO1530763.1 hypothetical protein [Variovorax ginsengisoli]